MENSKIVYRSKISFFIAAPTILLSVFVVYNFTHAKHMVPAIIFSMIFAFVILGLLFNTVYMINGNTLKVKSGFLINKTIDINSVTRIIENNGSLSAPAASFDRIEIFYNRYDSVVISPRDKKLFADNLKKINPAIVVSL